RVRGNHCGTLPACPWWQPHAWAGLCQGCAIAAGSERIHAMRCGTTKAIEYNQCCASQSTTRFRARCWCAEYCADGAVNLLAHRGLVLRLASWDGLGDAWGAQADHSSPEPTSARLALTARARAHLQHTMH